MECVLEKPVAPLLPSPPPAGQFLLNATLAAELVLWSWRRDSNPRPSDYKSDALPTELRQQLGTGALPRKLIPRIPSRCPGQLYKVSQRKLLAQWAAPTARTGHDNGSKKLPCRPLCQPRLKPKADQVSSDNQKHQILIANDHAQVLAE